MSEPEYGLSEGQFADRLMEKGFASADPLPEAETPAEPTEGQETTPGPDEPQQTAQEPTEAEPEGEKLYAGKYRSEQELENAYLELQGRLGSQGSELGDLRGKVSQMEAYLAGQGQSAQPQYSYSIDQVIEAAEANPQETAFWAIQNAPQSYDTVMDVWYQTDAKGASRFEQQIMAQALREQIRQELAPAIQPAMEMSRTNDFYQAWSDVAAQNPEINNHTKAILEAAESAPEVISILQNGDVDSKRRVLTQLYWMARGRTADTLAAAAQGVMQEQQAQNQHAKNQAQVVTSSGSSSADTTSADRLAAWKREFRKAAGLPLDLGGQ